MSYIMMKRFFIFINQFTSKPKVTKNHEVLNFFDYSSSDRVRIMRAAGRTAQKEQARLLREYDSRFGRI